MMPFDLKSTLFKQELEAFQQAKPGSHLIDVCAAFKKGENYHFLFPWADGGTLNYLWDKDPQEIVSQKKVKWQDFTQWVCKQCHGIIRDLRAIHEPHGASQTMDNADADELYGIHSDIKPDNILYFQTMDNADADELYGIHSDIKPDNILHFTDDGTPLGILKVSDLGLMKFHRLISRTVQSKSMGAAYQTYRAPEHDMNVMRSRQVDIWAFGCLFAEFLTWAIAGQGGIDHFKNIRVDEDRLFPDPKKGEWFEDHFFTMRTGEPEQKKSVAQVRANAD
jgi:serine/threonine protein kinase